MTNQPPSGDIPAHVKSFLRTHVDSVGLLEILLLLHANPEREWTPADVTGELRSSLASVSFRLARLRALGLASRTDGRFRYAPSNPDLAAAVTDLAISYRLYRLRVIDLLLSNLNQLRDFSDSFRLWEEKEDHE